jgi:hypothetical protein
VPRPIRPVGQPTRGKTALNRLRQVDVYTALALENTLVGGSPLIVDLGYGAYPWTALEMADRLRPINPKLRLLGIEIDAERVAVAQPYTVPGWIDFQLGGFNIAALTGANAVRLIRAYNVLRQYDEADVLPALHTMAEALEDGGVLIEGTCNPTGRIVVFDVYRKRDSALRHEALVFGTNFRAPVEPEDFRAILPKRLIHHAFDPDVSAFFGAWQREFLRWRAVNPRGAWVRSVQALFDQFPIDRRIGWIRRGYLTLRHPLRA